MDVRFEVATGDTWMEIHPLNEVMGSFAVTAEYATGLVDSMDGVVKAAGVASGGFLGDVVRLEKRNGSGRGS